MASLTALLVFLAAVSDSSGGGGGGLLVRKEGRRMGVVPPPPGVLLLEEAVVTDVETGSRRGVPSSAMTQKGRRGAKKLRSVIVVLCVCGRGGGNGRGVSGGAGMLLSMSEQDVKCGRRLERGHIFSNQQEGKPCLRCDMCLHQTHSSLIRRAAKTTRAAFNACLRRWANRAMPHKIQVSLPSPSPALSAKHQNLP